MSLMEAALDYATQGWPVFPIMPRGKRPIGRLVEHGFKDASTDPAVIRSWWTAEPQANIGTPTGTMFDVADLDSDDAMKRFIAIAGEHGVDVAKFPRARTGRGRHVLVRPTGQRNKVNVIPGMDWRGLGGYVLLPNSIHESGAVYAWVQKPKGALPAAPEWLLELLTAARAEKPDVEEHVLVMPGDGLSEVSDIYVRRAVEDELKGVQRAAEGTRNDTLNKAAFALGTMVGAAWLERSYAEIELMAAVRVTNLEVDDGTNSIMATIRSGLDAGILKPRPAPAPKLTLLPAPTPTAAPSEVAWTTAAELAERTPDQVAWVIHGMAAAGSITEIVASIKAGKSTFIGYAVRAILDGDTFLTAGTTPCEVWWITEERPTTFRRLLERAGLLREKRLHILILQEARGMTWPQIAASAVARAKPGDVMVADTIGRLAGIAGDSENDAGAAQVAMMPLEEASAAGLAVIFGRHARKAGGDPDSAGRGSSAWSGISDIVIQLTRAGESHPPTVRKINSVSRFEETPDEVLIQLTDDGYQLLGAEGALAYATAETVIKRALEEAGEMLLSDLTKLTDDDGKPLARGTVRRVLDGMEKLRRVQKVGRGGKGDPFRIVFKSHVATWPNPLATSISPRQQDLEHVTALPYSGQGAEEPPEAPEMALKKDVATWPNRVGREATVEGHDGTPSPKGEGSVGHVGMVGPPDLQPHEICRRHGGPYWERPESNGGGWVCSQCHDDPRELKRQWVRA